MMSGLSIISALTLLGGTAFAAFTTTATATGNTFSTTTPDLTLSVNGGGFGTSVAGATVGGLIPGTPGTSQNFTLANNSLDTANDLTVSLQLVATGGNTLPGSELNINVNCPSLGFNVTDTYGNWITTGYTLGVVVHNSTQACTMTPQLINGAGNADAGKSAVFDAVFTGSVGN